MANDRMETTDNLQPYTQLLNTTNMYLIIHEIVTTMETENTVQAHWLLKVEQDKTLSAIIQQCIEAFCRQG